MQKINSNCANKTRKSDNYSVKDQKDKASNFFGLLCISITWSAIVIPIIVEITK